MQHEAEKHDVETVMRCKVMDQYLPGKRAWA